MPAPCSPRGLRTQLGGLLLLLGTLLSSPGHGAEPKGATPPAGGEIEYALPHPLGVDPPG